LYERCEFFIKVKRFSRAVEGRWLGTEGRPGWTLPLVF
jgi:hypothetical protein